MSVVLAVHDQGQWIGAAIASVRAQTFADWELVVVNDGSTDDTAAEVARHTGDVRVRQLTQGRRERAVARNRGVAESSAPIVAFLDADDLWAPTKLERQMAAFAAAPEAGLCYTVARYVDADGRPEPIRRPSQPVPAAAFPTVVRGNPFILASVAVRRTALDAVGGFDESLIPLGCEDWDLWLRITRRFAVIGIDQELTRYRLHPGNTDQDQILASGLEVLDRLYADDGVAAAARLGLATARARLCWYHASVLARTRPAAARALARRAWGTAPRTLASRPAAGALARLLLRGPLRRLLP